MISVTPFICADPTFSRNRGKKSSKKEIKSGIVSFQFRKFLYNCTEKRRKGTVYTKK